MQYLDPAILALMDLGYSYLEARRVVKVVRDSDEEAYSWFKE